jgi:ATP-dependent exoDNAse (exonuclease V) beta subunit
MAHTLFSQSYYRERMKGYMDQLNLMYVAFTRAKDLLYIGIPDKDSREVRNMGDLLRAIMNRQADCEPCTLPLQNYLKGHELVLGSMPAFESREEHRDAWLFKSYPVNRDRRSLKVRIRNDQYFLDEEGIYRTERMYGNIMHQIFSRIITDKDLDKVLEHMWKTGQVPGNELEGLGKLIRQKLNHPDVKPWFSGDNLLGVYNEHAILCGDGVMVRPDRVVVEKDRVTVIDFKFGDMQKNYYKQQVANYMEKLRELGYPGVEGYIWYVMLDEIVKV